MEAAVGLVGSLRRLPRPGDPLPAQPAHRRIERREVEADRAGIGRRARSPATRRASSIAVLWCSAIAAVAGLADVVRGLGLALLPAQPLELQPLFMPAMRARHEVAPLVGGLVLALDAREAVDRRGRGEEDLRPPREGARARLGERDRIAFLVGRRRIGIDLVEEEIARRHRAQADRAVGAGHDQEPAGNSFDSMVLPASRERAGFTRSRSAGLSSISGSMRWRENRLASSTVGCTASIGPGAWWMT